MIEGWRCADGFASLVDALPVPLVIVGADGCIQYGNRGFAASVSRPAAGLAGCRIVDVLGREQLEALAGDIERALAGETAIWDGWVPMPSGEHRFLRRVLAPYPPVRGEGGALRVSAYSLLEEDRTALCAADIAWQTSEAIKAAAINNTSDGVITVEDCGTIIDFNPAAAAIFGLPRERALGRSVSELLIPAERREGFKRSLVRLISRGRSPLLDRRFKTEGIRQDGSLVALEVTVTRIMVGGRRLFTATVHERFSDSDCEFSAFAYHDPVTGLPNRLMLLRLLAEGLSRERPMVLANIYIDRFSSIRNSFGHAFADDLLIGLASRLETQLSSGDHLVRISDNVLALVFCGQSDDPGIGRRLDAIAEILRALVTPSGGLVFLSASIGVAPATHRHETPEEVLRDAEIAVSHARDGGGSRVVWFDPAMHARVIDQVRTEHDLRRALEMGVGLWVAYQPIVELVSGRLAGFEALARWNDPQRGAIPPSQFISIAEETGSVVALGRWVLTEACRQLARWQAIRMPALPELFMSVNLSPRQLEEPGFAETVRETIRESGIDPRWLKLEITESAVMRRPDESIVVLRELKKLGVKLSIDDFGTGYSSLSYLHRFPLDSLKIDRSFVVALHKSEENRSIVAIIVDLARIFGFDIIAEGIETDEDAHLLCALSCDFGQGYLYARPQAPAAIEPLLIKSPPWMKGRWGA